MKTPRSSRALEILPRASRLVLEPRMMFDGAALASIDAHTALAQEDSASALSGAAAQTARNALDADSARLGDSRSNSLASETINQSAQRQLVVIDARVEHSEQLLQGIGADADILIIARDQQGLNAIVQAMATQSYSSVSILAHSEGPARMVLGAEVLETANLQNYQAELQAIGQSLVGQRDLLLFACDLAADPDGLNFLGAFARATGADVAASRDSTGGTARGGNWALESSIGSIESRLAISEQSLTAYDGLLAGAPQVTLTGGGDTLLGGNFTVTARFDNVGPDAAYAPYVDVFVPRAGADGGGSPDGLTVTSATFLGQTLTPTVITLSAGDITAGQVAHPVFRSAGGSNLVGIPAGFVAGDQLLVYQLPFGSFTPNQPAADIVISGSVSNLADVGTPLNLVARGGFSLGNTPLDDFATDPSFVSANTSIAVNPRLYTLTTTYIGPEDETATGPNFARAYRIDLDLAAGQTLSNVDLSAILSPGMQYLPIVGTPASITGFDLGVAPPSGWTNVNGVLFSGSGVSVATPSLSVPGDTVTRELTSPLIGTASTRDASMVVQFYVPLNDASSSPVIQADSADDSFLTVGSAAQANWTPLDVRDLGGPVSTTVVAAHTLEAQANAIQKTATVTTDAGATGLSPGDRIRYDLNLQISDYFGFGGNPGAQDLLVTDFLSDGLEFLDATTAVSAANPTLQVSRNGATENYTLTNGVNYSVSTQADGRQIVVFNLRSVLPAAANGQLLLGDLFAADTTLSAGTTAVISFNTRVLDAYRVGPPDDQGNLVLISGANSLNEGDRIVNRAVFAATVLDPALDPLAPALQTETDDTLVRSQMAAAQVAITATRINGVLQAGTFQVTPGDDVTYCMTYTVPTGDFENFALTAYIPLPLFHVADPDANGTNSALTLQGGAFTDNPSLANFSVNATGGDGSGLSSAVTVTQDAVSNSLSFNLGQRDDVINAPLTITICFTLRSTDLPFADRLLLTAQANSAGTSTAIAPQASNAIGGVTVATPVLSVIKGAVGEDVVEASSSFDPVFSAGDPRSLIRPAGDTSANPLVSGVTLDQASISANLNSNIASVDAGDTVRFAIAVVNSGTAPRGAFDVTITDVLPSNIDPASLANLRVVRGDGSAVAFTGSLATLFTTGIQLTDPSAGQGAIGVGAIGSTAVTDGSNVVIVTYDARVLTTAPAGAIAASTASVTNYAGQDAGTNYAATALTDSASVSTPTPLIAKTIVGTDQAFTSGNDVVIGEIVTYQVVITVPEGATPVASFVDTLDPNLSFVSLDSVTTSAGLSFTPGLPAFSSASVSDVSGGVANRVTFNLGNIQNNNTDNASSETITLQYRVVVSNVLGNQQDTLQNNNASLSATGISVSAQAPDVKVVEPAVTITNTPSVSSIDNGDTVTYTLVITSNGAVPAFEVNLADVVPAGMTYVGGSLTRVSGPAPTTALTESGGTISASWSQLAVGDTVTITYQASVNAGVVLGQTLDHTAQVGWSSLAGTGNTNLSPLAASNDAERDGSGGVNDYVASDTAPVTVTTQTPVLTLIASSEASSAGANVVPGEIVRYRMVVQLPESSAPDFRISPTLPTGVRFLNDGSATLGFISDNGITSSTIAGAGLNITGGGSVASDVSGLAPVTVIPGASIVNAAGTALGAGALASGASPVFRLGTIDSNDTDANREFVVIEFNAVIDNSAVTSNAVTRDVSFSVESGGVLRGTSNTVTVTEQEPAITNLDKQVVSVAGNLVTYEVTFTNSGTATAHDVRLTDPFSGAVNTAFSGAGSVTGVPGGASNLSTASGLDIAIPTLAPGASVTIRYQATVTDTNLAVPARNAEVRYTSLNESTGKTLSVSTSSGTVVSSTNGERTGSVADYGGAENDYLDSDPAGLGTISGKLWDDTAIYNQTADGSEPGLTARTVTLLWAGQNGSFGDGDDQTFTTTSSSVAGQEGRYSFGMAPQGNYRISTGTSFTDPSVGPVRVYTDAGGGVGTDGLISLTLGDAEARQNQNFGFVEINDAPTVAGPVGPVSVNEDASVPFTGGNTISVADPDAGSSTTNNVTLSVLNGTLSLSSIAGVTMTGNGTGAVSLTGSITNLNLALASLSYQGVLNFSGSDTLSVRIDDRGNTGDADGDNVPNEVVGDNLFATRTVPLTIIAQPDPPVATTSTRSTTEDVTITGNTLFPSLAQQALGDVGDTDPDLPYGDTIAVQGLVAGTVAGPVTGSLGSSVTGTYGSLVLGSNGVYTYTPGPAANALKAGEAAQDIFTYTIFDSTASTSTAQIIINLTGTNDTVTALPDTRSMTEDQISISGNAIGGNGVAGGQPGDVADPDPDGDAVTVRGLAAGTVAGPLTGNLGGSGVVGTWGSLILNADGTYTYTPDQALVQALRTGDTVQDIFSYTVRDPAGSTATTTITININGSDDQVSAVLDQRTIAEPNPLAVVAVTGNALTPSAAQIALGDRADIDVDAFTLSVVGIQAGVQSGTLSGGQGAPVLGQYGSITLATDGSYSYTPNANAQTVAAGQTVTDVFTYSITNGNGSFATTRILINITGANDPIVALADTDRTSAGASAPITGNVATGVAPVGSAAVLQADTDLDSTDSKTVVGVATGVQSATLAGQVATPITGQYGNLVLNADGSYSYRVDNNNAAVLALAQGQNLVDVFSYTVTDSNGAFATTTLTITINGENNPPAGADHSYRISEDLTLENGVPLAFPVTDYGFTDPDAGDRLTAVIIDALPVSGTLRLNGVAVTAGQSIPVAQLGALSYSPALNANSQTLNNAHPFFDFSVVDSSGLRDPIPNRFTIVIDPINDPPVAPSITRTIDSDAVLSQANSRVIDMGRPSDPDEPIQTLSVTVQSVPNPATQGTFYRPDGTAVVAGTGLSLADLQNLRFVPSQVLSGTPDANGLVSAGALGYRVSDGTGGSADGTININVRRVGRSDLPPEARPLALAPPTPPAMVFSPTPVSDQVRDMQAREISTNLSMNRVLGDRATAPDLDAGEFFQGTRWDSLFNEERLGQPPAETERTQPVPATPPLPPVVDDKNSAVKSGSAEDCGPDQKPKPKAKVKPRPIPKSLVPEGAAKEPSKFSEQVQQAKKRFRPPPAVRPAPIGRTC